MITFDSGIKEIEITQSGKYIKLELDTALIKYIVGTLISVDFESVIDIKGIPVRSFANHVEIGEIVAVKFQDGTLHRLEEGKDL